MSMKKCPWIAVESLVLPSVATKDCRTRLGVINLSTENLEHV